MKETRSGVWLVLFKKILLICLNSYLKHVFLKT